MTANNPNSIDFITDGPRLTDEGRWYAHWKLRHHLGPESKTGPEEGSCEFKSKNEAIMWLKAEANKLGFIANKFDSLDPSERRG